MTRFAKEFECDRDSKVVDHNGNYDYRYVSWLEDKLEILEEQNDAIINDRCEEIINS
jgi:hypothetical protein